MVAFYYGEQMRSNQLYLFRDMRFLPIFIVQFCGCLNDNILKNALIILITYKLSNQLQYPQFLILLANVLFVLPFVLLASIAGQVADKYERATIVKIVKLFEIAVVAFSAFGFIHNNLIILFSCIGLMGVHSAFFGPIKYSVLPDHLEKNELLAANGFVEAGTFISIFIGTIIGGFYNLNANLVICLAIAISIIGIAASYFLPKSNNFNSKLKINFNLFQETQELLGYVYKKKHLYLAILGISWFWFIGAAILAQLPSLTKDILGADENVANLFLATFSIGVGSGSFLCNKLFKNQITVKYVFISAVGISLCGIDLFFASTISAVNYEPEQLKSIVVFLSKKHHWRIIIDLFLLAAIGGLYIVPLFAVMQYFSLPSHRSRVIAANNLINSVFMACSTALLSLLFYLGYSIPFIILLVSLLNMVVAFYIYELTPEVKIIPTKLLKVILKFVFNKLYKVEVRGLENFHKAGKRSIIIANHLSYIDPALLSVYLPSTLIFAIHSTVAKAWWVKPFLKVVKALPVDNNNAMAIKTLIEYVKKNKRIAIFPEGRISTTGSLMKIYEGPGMIADKADCPILPIRIDGTQFTHFSKLKNIPQTKIFTKVIITILPPVKFQPLSEMGSRDRRKYIGEALYNIMTDMMFESSGYQQLIFKSLIDAAKIYGFNHPIIQDANAEYALTYRQLIAQSFTFANLLTYIAPSEPIGLLLPNTAMSLSLFYGLQAANKLPVMLGNSKSMVTFACQAINIKTLIICRQLTEKMELTTEINALAVKGVQIIELNELLQQPTKFGKYKAFLGSLFPQTYYNKIAGSVEENKPAAILFTSGSQSPPQAVALSHKNLQANRCQLSARLDFNIHDIAFNALPISSCFGLNSLLLTTLSGIRTFLYHSPERYRIIPEIIYDIGATIMFSTDLFLYNYGKYAHPYDFYSLRHVFAGEQKLHLHTKELWLNKYGIRIFASYSAPECSAIIATNTPMHSKADSAGKLMPKITYHLQPVPELVKGGRLHVKGPNIMLGYIRNNDGNLAITPLKNSMLGKGWHDTGDIAEFDEEGYLRIICKAEQLAKINGELISLATLEQLACSIDPDNLHAAIYATANAAENQEIILFTTNNKWRQDTFGNLINQFFLSANYFPASIINLPKMPLLTNGKIDYRTLKHFIKDRESENKKPALAKAI